jgi:hypothetical protein
VVRGESLRSLVGQQLPGYHIDHGRLLTAAEYA